LSKIDLLFRKLNFDNVDICFLSETFLDHVHVADSYFNHPDYNFLHFDRQIPNPKIMGGGVLVLYKKSISILPVAAPIVTRYSLQFCELLAFDII
jgi:hypothetical protein